MPVQLTAQTVEAPVSDTEFENALVAADALAKSGLNASEITESIQKANSPSRRVSGNSPALRKLDSNPAIELADQTAASLLWPWLDNGHKDGITNQYVMVWSTDHSDHAGSGTWLATASTPEGPWDHHGMIFRDDVTGGEQHETPSLMWDEVNSRWLMYYQLKFVPGYSNQLTMVATAPSILTSGGAPEVWTVLGVAVTETHSFNAGDGHSGYFNPFRYDDGWYGFGLYGGTNNSRKAFFVSNDNGLTYTPNPNIMQSGQHLINHLPGFDAENWLIKHNSGAMIERNGQLWLIAPVGAASSGGAEIPMGRICAFRVQADGVTLGRGVDITPPLQPWEDQVLGVDQLGNAVEWNNKLYVSYRQGGGNGGFGIMEVL